MAILGFSFGRDTRPPAVLVTPSLLPAMAVGIAGALTADNYLPGLPRGTTVYGSLFVTAATYGVLWLQYWQQKRRLAVLGIVAPSHDDLKRTA